MQEGMAGALFTRAHGWYVKEGGMEEKTKGKELVPLEVVVDGWVSMAEEDETTSEKKSTKRIYWIRPLLVIQIGKNDQNGPTL